MLRQSLLLAVLGAALPIIGAPSGMAPVPQWGVSATALVQAPRRPKKPAAKATPVRRVLIKSPAVGTWTLRKGDIEDFSTRLVLRSDATFTFIGPNFRSDGLFGIREGNLVLNYRKVDGRAVKPDSIRLVVPLAIETFSFVLDGRTFAMKGKPTPVPVAPQPPTSDGTPPPPPVQP